MHDARENRFQKKKTEAGSLAEKEAATSCLGWYPVRGIVQKVALAQARVEGALGGDTAWAVGSGRRAEAVGLGVQANPQ